MKELCDDIYYNDASVNSQCSNYKNIYEQVINYFVGDIKLYNDNVLKYNEYQKSIQSSLLVNNYVTDKNYIDYNGDPIVLSPGKTWICVIWDEYGDDVVYE